MKTKCQVVISIFLLISVFKNLSLAQDDDNSPQALIKRYAFECYAEEKAEQDKTQKTIKRCKELDETYKDKMDKMSPNEKLVWDNLCADGDWLRVKPTRPAIPESCTTLGEQLMAMEKLDEAENVLTKACGLYFSEAAYAKDKEKAIENLRRYGCATPEMAKKYGLKGIPSCSAERILGCLRMGDVLIKKEEYEKAQIYYRRGCDGGEATACERLKNKKTGSDLLMYAAVILIGLSVFLFAKMVFQDESQFKAGEQLEDTVSKADIAKHGIVLQYSRPFFKRYISPVVSSMKYKRVLKEKYKRPLAAAGLTNLMSAEDFYSFKLFLIIGFPVVFMGVRAFLEETWPLSLMPLLGSIGFFYPNIWINGKKQQRQVDVINSMPFCVDMLALSVEAGLDFIAAMTKVVEKAKPSALTEEFQILIKEIKIGASRAEALRNMSWRIDLIQISSFCATLIAADSVGASIGPILKSLAVEIRQKKSSDIEKRGATAATKILFPMLFLITPAVLLIVAGPLVVEFISGPQ
ncbi:MAG: type II secretion system F family protein [Bdellovibrio sp.]|nr:type II secretion system F family protein [Bdellovibrio sp.]